MRLEKALEKLRALDLTKFGVKHLELFGSTARDQAQPESDLDLLVEFDGPVDFMRYAGLWNYLEDSLDIKVDLVIKDSLRLELRPYVEPEVVRVT